MHGQAGKVAVEYVEESSLSRLLGYFSRDGCNQSVQSRVGDRHAVRSGLYAQTFSGEVSTCLCLFAVPVRPVLQNKFSQSTGCVDYLMLDL